MFKNVYFNDVPVIVRVATKTFETSHRIGCGNNIQTIVTKSPSPKQYESFVLTRTNKIRGSREFMTTVL